MGKQTQQGENVPMYSWIFKNLFPLTSSHFLPLNFPTTRNKDAIPHLNPEGFLSPLLLPQTFIFNIFSPQSHALNTCVCTDVFKAWLCLEKGRAWWKREFFSLPAVLLPGFRKFWFPLPTLLCKVLNQIYPLQPPHKFSILLSVTASSTSSKHFIFYLQKPWMM